MENVPFIDSVPIKMVIFRGCLRKGRYLTTHQYHQRAIDSFFFHWGDKHTKAIFQTDILRY